MSNKNKPTLNVQAVKQPTQQAQTPELTSEGKDLATNTDPQNQATDPQLPNTSEDQEAPAVTDTKATEAQDPATNTTDTATAPQDQQPAAEVTVTDPVKAIDPQPEIKPVDNNLKTIEISANTPRPQRNNVGIQTKVAEDETKMSSAELINKATREKNLNMSIFQEDVAGVIQKLSSGNDCDELQAAKYAESLYRRIVQSINADKTTEEFGQQWTFLVQHYKENKDDGFGAHRAFRGVRHWSLGHEAYQLYQALWSLIDATNRYNYDKAAIMRVVNFQKIANNSLLNEAGRGRLMSFYI